jgi:alpha-beta hydrolase superfamily lysophospholipase
MPEKAPLEPGRAMRLHRLGFILAMTCISRFFILRDRVLDAVTGRRGGDSGEIAVSRMAIPSGGNTLDAVFVEPAHSAACAALLICHGIGETVGQWRGVQEWLAQNGVASLVFDYSGYGRSSGAIDWSQLEQDAIAAFAACARMAPRLPISVLGFSLGSGIAAATIHRVAADRLILCEAFTSFREAAHAAGLPKHLGRLVPPIWQTRESLPTCALPVLILHGEKDRLFPVKMAEELLSRCGADARLIVVPKTAHNQPFRKPHVSYWGPVVAWLTN